MTRLALLPGKEALEAKPLDRTRRTVDVMHALILHDIKSRFFGSGLGQIVMILWPFAHVIVLLAVYYFAHRSNPYGSSLIQYSCVSIMPFIIFNYCGRWTGMASQNRSFLQYPIIKPLDLLLGRACLELMSMTIVTVLVIILLLVCGADVMPASPKDAAECVAATFFLAMGFGFLNAPFAFLVPLWTLVMALIIIALWVSSGVAFIVTSLPESLQYPLSFNPLLHCVEWMRSAYYPDYPTSVLDKIYVIKCSIIMMTTGLILMRLLRRFF